jgi:hypothetical protein
MRSRSSLSLSFVVCGLLGFAGVATVSGLGCAGVKGHATTTGAGGNNSGNGGSTGTGNSGTGNSTGTGGGGTVPITPISGSFTCKDLDSSGSCAAFDTSKQGTLDNGGSGAAPSIAYPLDHALFPSNLGPIQVQLTTSGSAARITFQTTSSSNVNVNYYGACESVAGGGCAVTLPLALTQMFSPASQAEDIQITGRVLTSGGSVTSDSQPIHAAWALTGVTGGLYYWTVLPNQPKCMSSTMADTGHYCVQDTTATPTPPGTAIYRYDFSKDNPAPQQVWTDDGGPASTPAYLGGPQSYVASSQQYGGHCIGCHSITNDGKYMALGLGGSSTYNGSNWMLLDIAAQSLDIINPTASTDANSTRTSNPSDYWKKFRKDAFGVESTWGPNDDYIVTMYQSKVYISSVTPGTGTATLGVPTPALSKSASAIGDRYQSDPFWSHDGKYLAYTSFDTTGPADMYNVGGLDGDLKTGGQIAISDATASSITDNGKVIVPRVNGMTSYYPCISEDSNWVVYNQSNCNGNSASIDSIYSGITPTPYGAQVCDGYDDSTAKPWLVSTTGTTNVKLDAANGGDATYDNSWPRFSPDIGTFRGQKLYWVAFSSRRPYGTQLNTGAIASTQPQLWFAGVAVGEINASDPSFAPVWLPGQNPGGVLSGNHTPQWVKVAIVIDQP